MDAIGDHDWNCEGYGENRRDGPEWDDSEEREAPRG